MNNFYVYGYFDPRTDVCFYVGKGSGKRAWIHLREPAIRKKKKTLFYKTLSQMLSQGAVPKVVLFSVGLMEQAAFDMERHFITVFGRLDTGTGSLCNHTDGGDGVAGCRTERQYASICRAARNGGLLRERAIEAYDPDTGITERTFSSQREAEEHGFEQRNISACIHGKRKTHRGHAWRFV